MASADGATAPYATAASAGLIEMGRPSHASPSAVDDRCYGRALALADQSMARRWGTVSVLVTACAPVSWSVAVSEDPAGCQQPAAMVERRKSLVGGVPPGTLSRWRHGFESRWGCH